MPHLERNDEEGRRIRRAIDGLLAARPALERHQRRIDAAVLRGAFAELQRRAVERVRQEARARSDRRRLAAGAVALVTASWLFWGGVYLGARTPQFVTAFLPPAQAVGTANALWARTSETPIEIYAFVERLYQLNRQEVLACVLEASRTAKPQDCLLRVPPPYRMPADLRPTLPGGGP